MKKIILTSIFALITILSFSQEKLASYKNSFFDDEFNILITKEEKGKFKLFIMALSIDNLYKEVGFILSEKEINNFRNKLTEAKTKFGSWKQTAIENNVSDLGKEMNIKCNTLGFFGTSSGWKFDYTVECEYEFKIITSKSYLILRSQKLVSSDNQFIDHEGFLLIFQNENEIDDFLSKISDEKISKYIKQEYKSELFQ
jgi:hypothetical protein